MGVWDIANAIVITYIFEEYIIAINAFKSLKKRYCFY